MLFTLFYSFSQHLKESSPKKQTSLIPKMTSHLEESQSKNNSTFYDAVQDIRRTEKSSHLVLNKDNIVFSDQINDKKKSKKVKKCTLFSYFIQTHLSLNFNSKKEKI